MLKFEAPYDQSYLSVIWGMGGGGGFSPSVSEFPGQDVLYEGRQVGGYILSYQHCPYSNLLLNGGRVLNWVMEKKFNFFNNLVLHFTNSFIC